jgi:hypothetical protein
MTPNSVGKKAPNNLETHTSVIWEIILRAFWGAILRVRVRVKV